VTAPHDDDPRAQAIAAMLKGEHGWMAARDDDFSEESRVAAMVDAIPGDVHARLAIDKGALVPFGWWHVSALGFGEVTVGEPTEHAARGSLYRLADP
jgi:hypothetical protein